MTDSSNNILTENEGAKCPKCQTIFFGQMPICNKCGVQTEPTKWYSRFCLERVLLIVTLILGASVLASPITQFTNAQNITTNANPIAFPILIAVFILGSYFVASLFGLGGLTERFAEDNIPDRARVRFSWKRYFSEILYLLAFLILFHLVLLGFLLWKSC